MDATERAGVVHIGLHSSFLVIALRHRLALLLALNVIKQVLRLLWESVLVLVCQSVIDWLHPVNLLSQLQPIVNYPDWPAAIERLPLVASGPP